MDGLKETYGDEFKIVRINIDKSDGVKLAREHGVIGQPSYIFFDREGEEISDPRADCNGDGFVG